jgi:PAS domain S-box-containing protein
LFALLLWEFRRRERLETALRESEANYRALVESSADAILLTAPDGRVFAANPAACRLFGRTEEEICRLGRAGVVDTGDPRLAAALEERRRTGRFVGALRFRRADGSLFEGELSSTVFRDRSGEERTSMVIRDLSARKHAEAERERLRTAIEQAGECVIITDPAGTIQYVNPAFEAVTGYPRVEVLGQSPRLLKSGRQDAAFYRNLWAAITGGRTWQGRFVNKRKDGTFYTEEATISPVRDAAGNILSFVAVKRDITDQLELQERLLQAQKMEAIGRLAGGIAHDFNNLLMGILNYLELCRDGLSSDHPVRPYLDEIQQDAERSAALVRQLLTFARKQPAAPQPFDLNAGIEIILPLLRRLLGAGVPLLWRPEAALGPVMMDPAQFDQIVVNLVLNARDALDESGTICIATRAVSPDTVFRPPELSGGPAVALVVADTGCGMDAETKRHLFEPYFTTRARGRGTGLGLATVHGIVEQHGGAITVESAVGQGTTITIYLPEIPAQTDDLHPSTPDATPGAAE